MSSTELITPSEAEAAISSRITHSPDETLPLARCIGATLRENVDAERDQPPFDRVTMDGIAVHSSALSSGVTQFQIEATQAAGEPPTVLEAQDGAIEVMTGAVLPMGCDCVIPIEQLRMAGRVASLTPAVKSSPYQNVHRRGSDARQGQRLLGPGTRLRAPEIAVAASAGRSLLKVGRQPSIMVMSTGSELIEPGEPIAAFQVRRSNVYAVTAALRRRGFLEVRDGHVLDSETELLENLSRHLDSHEVLVLSGGVSMGKFDLVPKVLVQLGVVEVFHKIAQRPGKPMWFGVGPRGQAVFGLPGNPVSTLVCLSRYVIPALAEAMGTKPRARERIALGAPFTTRHAMAFFLPIAIDCDESGRLWAVPKPTNNSGDFLTLTRSDGFVELPAGPNTYPLGFVANIYRW
jgi:molybdopterin molybdotransferase